MSSNKKAIKLTGLARANTKSQMLTLALGILSCMSSAVLPACGGGGDDGGDDNEDADATGVWTGTDARDGSTTVPVTVLVDSNGQFSSVSANLLLVGRGSTDGDSLSATATGWPAPGVTFANGGASGAFTLRGTVFERSSISGAYAGASESGNLTLTYDVSQSEKSVDIALLAGNYATGGGATLSITGSSMTYNSSAGPNCIGNGTIQHADSSINVFTWSMTFSGCDATNGNATGVAFLRDSAPGTNNRLTFTGSFTTDPIIIVATK